MDCSVNAQKLRQLGGRGKDFAEITSKRLWKQSRQKSLFLGQEKGKPHWLILLAIQFQGGMWPMYKYMVRLWKMAKEGSSNVFFSTVFLWRDGLIDTEQKGRGHLGGLASRQVHAGPPPCRSVELAQSPRFALQPWVRFQTNTAASLI